MPTQAEISAMAAAARKYIKRMRNTRKQCYACAYFNYRRGFERHPNQDDYGLTFMGAQAVRHQIDAIFITATN
jgi:hypothetical protein